MLGKIATWFGGLGALLAVSLAAPSAHGLEVGAGERGRPALRRVGVPEPATPGALSVAADLGAGVTEALTDADAAHGRFSARAAAAVAATRWLSLGAWLGGRYDLHGRDTHGVDDGWLFQPELSSRVAWRRGALGYGFEANVRLPAGDDLAASVSGLGADGRLLVSGQGSQLLLAGAAGYRLDRSARAAGDVSRLRFGDRSALGVSDYDALLLGLGLAYAAGQTLLFGEASAELLLGSPQLSASPLWLSIGARRPFGPEGWGAELSLDGLASLRPDFGAAALFPIEPRVTLNFGLRYQFGARRTATAAPPLHVLAPATGAPPAVASVPKPASVELLLLDDRGQPLQRAQAVVTQGETETPLIETSAGHYRLDDARPGRGILRVRAEGFQPFEREIDVQAGAQARVEARVEPALPAGQVRGLVRSFRGQPLAATIHLEPVGGETKTDTEGFFQLDVAPGEYEVLIEAPGYKPQRRKAKVDQQGVVIVNADLSR